MQEHKVAQVIRAALEAAVLVQQVQVIVVLMEEQEVQPKHQL